MNEAIFFKDKNIFLITLQKGIYLIKEKIVEVINSTDKIEVDSLDNICPVTRTYIISHYTSNGKDGLKPIEYNSKVEELYSKAEGFDGFKKWSSSEDEYVYNKFISTWKPVNKNIESIGDPLRFSIKETCLETGCQFIKPAFLNGTSNEHTFFQYDRVGSIKNILNNCFNNLGMSFKKDVNYQKTANQMIWSNATHSNFKYVAAFGDFILGEKWKNIYDLTDTLDVLIKKYEEDKEELENIITKKYKEHFGKVNSNDFDFNGLLLTLRNSKSNLEKVSIRIKSNQEFFNAKRGLNDAIELIENNFK